MFKQYTKETPYFWLHALAGIVGQRFFINKKLENYI